MTAVRILRLAAGGDGVGQARGREDGLRPAHRAGRPGGAGAAARAPPLRPRPAWRGCWSLRPSGWSRAVLTTWKTTAAAASSSTSISSAQREARRTFVGDALRRIAKLDVPDPELVPAVRGLRVPHQDHAPRGRRRTADRPASARPARLRLRAGSLPHHPTRADVALGRGSARCASSCRRGVRQIVLRLDRWRRPPRGARSRRRPGPAPRPCTRRAEGPRRRRHLLGSTGGRARPAPWRRATSRFPPRCSSRCIPPWATGSAPSRSPRWETSPGRHVWDLYAGIGETTAALADAGASVESVESDPRAVAEAEARGPAAARHVGRVERVVGQTSRAGSGHHQPAAHRHGRAGDGRARPAGARAGSSTSPATPPPWPGTSHGCQGFRLSSALAFDLFPQTAHVETVAVLDRAS